MDEASLCERIALIQSGRILRVDAPDQITANYGKPLYAVRSEDFYRLLRELRVQPFTERVEPFGEFLHLTTGPETNETQLHHFLEKHGHPEAELKPILATVEDVFLDLM